MSKKILLMALVAVLAISAVGCVVASESQITISDVDFNIPSGFVEDTVQEVVNQQKQSGSVSYVENAKVFTNNKTEVALLVSEYDGFEIDTDFLKTLGGEAKTIGGVDGYITEDDGFHVFSYSKDGKLVVISAESEDLIDQFISN